MASRTATPAAMRNRHTLQAQTAANGRGQWPCGNGHGNGNMPVARPMVRPALKSSVCADRASDSATEPTMQELLRRPARSADKNAERKIAAKAEQDELSRREIFGVHAVDYRMFAQAQGWPSLGLLFGLRRPIFNPADSAQPRGLCHSRLAIG